MISAAPWLAPALSWFIVLILLSLVLLAAFTTKRATHADYITTLIASLMLALAGASTAMLSLFPRGTFDLDLVGIELATLRGVASILYLGVLLHVLAVGPRWVHRIDKAIDHWLAFLQRDSRHARRH